MKRVKICFLLALTILFWCLGEISEKDVYAADQKKQGIDVILIIDQSGSMGWKERDPERRALNMADFFVKNLPDTDLRLGVYSFATDVHEIFRFDRVLSEKQDKILIENAIKELEYSGDTDMGDVFEKCADIWEQIQDDAEERKQMIVFMTDGEISFGDDIADENLKQIEDSRCRMNEALKRINLKKCPIYVIAFGTEAVEGKDAKTIGEMEGNYFIEARNKGTLEEAYNNVFENIFDTKAVKHNNIQITPENNVVSLDNDDNQNGLNVNITTGDQGNGSVLDKDTRVKIRNDETGEIWDSGEFEDYTDKYLGRLLKIPEAILRSGPLSLVFETDNTDVINLKEYFLYDIQTSWRVEDDASYEMNEQIKLDISVEGIDTNSFVTYAIFNKLDLSDTMTEEILPDKVYAGDQVKEIKVYGSSLEEKNLTALTGVKALLDTENNSFTTTVAFSEPGDYQVYIYGESEKGFTISDPLHFSVLSTDTEEIGIKDRIKQIFNDIKEFMQMIWGKFMEFSTKEKIVVSSAFIGVIIILLIIRAIFRGIGNLLYRHHRDEEDDE